MPVLRVAHSGRVSTRVAANSPSTVARDSAAPPRSAGSTLGSMTVRHMVAGLAPSVRAAC